MNVFDVNFAWWQRKSCLIPVQRFLRRSRSIHFGDVSKANGRETASLLRTDHATRNALAAQNNNEAEGLGKGKSVLLLAVNLQTKLEVWE